MASSSLSSGCEFVEIRLTRLGVSGNMTRKISLNVDIKSDFDNCPGIRMLSRASKMAFRVLAEEAWRRASRVSLFTTY